jgi:rubredoxin
MILRFALLALCMLVFAAAARLPSYNETLSYEALHFAKVASCDSLDEIRAWNCPVCKSASSNFKTYWAQESASDIQGFVGHDISRNAIVVAFRGSKTLANWIANLKFARVDSPFKECRDCQVHKGFLDDYNSIADELFNAVNEIRSKTGITRVLITGHSLGAVLALFTAVDLVIHDGFAEPVLYAFGLPRVGNEGEICFVGFGVGRLCPFD